MYCEVLLCYAVVCVYVGITPSTAYTFSGCGMCVSVFVRAYVCVHVHVCARVCVCMCVYLHV